MSFKKVDSQVSFPKLEEEVLKFWEDNKIFEKSVEKNPEDKTFIFYEGPPTANGKPGLHHVLARSFKDIIPRYKTMRGFRVERKAGWDTHGLPVELQVEKALGLKSKQEIENIIPGDSRASVIKFNEECKKSVWEYRDLWEKMTRRMGYWVDMGHPYVTYENKYIESVWWQLAQIAKIKKDFVYKGHKVVPYCYRCGTALSSHEVAQGYKKVKDLSVTVKFELSDEPGTYLLAWTTTPWTLPGNVALAVNKDIAYTKVESEGNKHIVAEALLGQVFADKEYSVLEKVEGRMLVGKSYKPLFDYYTNDTSLKHRENGWKIYHADFVTTDVGTGIAHEAPAFGEDDMELAKEVSLPVITHVDTNGVFKKEVVDFPGLVAKPKDDPHATDIEVIRHLAKQNLLFAKEKYEHDYPFCWRCDTPLLYFAKPSWFIRMSELRDTLVANNELVEWVPEHIKEGRFGEWLRGVKDWAISRERYWGTPLPIWECEKCGHTHFIESLSELTERSGKELEDVHKPYIDEVEWDCECGGVMKRTPEVMDVWFDSGAMPLAQFEYPAKATDAVKQKIEGGKYFPADYICEAIDQTRGWFYTLHAIATLLHTAGKVPAGNAYKHVICLGHVLDGEGKKMSKSKGNVIDPFQMFDEYGADPLRWMLFSINQPGLPKRFDLKGMRDVMNRVFRMLWNSYSFFTTYASIDNWQPKKDTAPSTNLLDQWILSELQVLVRDVTKALDAYDVYSSTQKIESFIDNLSNWFIRRSRKRFWKSEDDNDKEQAFQTLYDVLVTLTKVMAPFTPFVTEEMYRNLTGEVSVHLADFPETNEKMINEELNTTMHVVRDLVTLGLKLRAEAGIKVRQPLSDITVNEELPEELQEILKEELNVKVVKRDIGAKGITLNTVINEELKLEGEAREIIRAIQEGRKKAGFNVEDRIVLGYVGKESVFTQFNDMIAKEVLATEVVNEKMTDPAYEEAVEIEEESFIFTLKKV